MRNGANMERMLVRPSYILRPRCCHFHGLRAAIGKLGEPSEIRTPTSRIKNPAHYRYAKGPLLVDHLGFDPSSQRLKDVRLPIRLMIHIGRSCWLRSSVTELSALGLTIRRRNGIERSCVGIEPTA